MTSLNCYLNALNACYHKKPFYASDLGMNGGEINGLSLNGFIRPTGNSKTVLLHLGTDRRGNRILREVEAKEWVFVRTANEWLRECQKQDMQDYLRMAREFLALADALGIGAE